jgi:hypothetical protein
MALAHRPQFSADQANAAFGAFAADLGRSAFTGLAAVALAWLALRGRMNASFASVALLVVLLFDLWPIGNRLMAPVIGDPVAKSLDYGRDDVVEFLEKVGPRGSFRVLAPEEAMPNRLAGFGIASLGGMHAAKPRLFQDLLDAQATGDPRWWRLLNVKYIVLSQPLEPNQTPPFLKPVYSGSGAVYENVSALPRATVVGAYGLVPATGRAAIDSIRAGRHDAGSFTWLVKDPGEKLGPVDGATATIVKYGLHDVDIDVITPGTGILRLADLWYPDWTVSVDGRPAEMLRADHALRAVVVPAGKHHVKFRFASPSVTRGFAVSIASFCIALALLAAGWLFARRAPANYQSGAA